MLHHEEMCLLNLCNPILQSTCLLHFIFQHVTVYILMTWILSAAPCKPGSSPEEDNTWACDVYHIWIQLIVSLSFCPLCAENQLLQPDNKVFFFFFSPLSSCDRVLDNLMRVSEPSVFAWLPINTVFVFLFFLFAYWEDSKEGVRFSSRLKFQFGQFFGGKLGSVVSHTLELPSLVSSAESSTF